MMQRTVTLYQLVRIPYENVPPPPFVLFGDFHDAGEYSKMLSRIYGRRVYGIVERKVILHINQSEEDQGLLELHDNQNMRIPFG